MQGSLSAISVVIASLNEEEGIGHTIKEIHRYIRNPYVLVVDGKSDDRTFQIATEMGAHVIRQKGIGKGDALSQGLQQLDSSVRYIVFIDADFTYPAEFIPKMIEILNNDPTVGMVIGDRFEGELDLYRFPISPFYLGNRLLALAQHMFNGIKLNDPLSGLRVVRKKVLRNWKPKSKGFDIEAELNFLVERAGYKIVEIPIIYRPRLGEKKLKLRHGLGIFMRILNEAFIDHLSLSDNSKFRGLS